MARIQGVIDVKDLYDVQEAAKKLKCGVATVWRRVKEKKLNTIKIGRGTYFLKSEIDKIK